MALDLQTAAKKLLTHNIGLKKGEKVVVVTDRKDCPIFSAVCSQVQKMGGKLEEVRITPRRTNSQPLPQLKDTFASANVIIGITDKSISHCPETRRARKQHGTRAITMPGVHARLFIKAMNADQKKVKEIGEDLAEKLRKTGVVRISTPSGTNLTVRTVTRAVSVDDGDSTKKGRLNNLPYGETTMAPIDKAEGELVIDFSKIGLKTKDKAMVELRQGRIVKWNSKGKKLVDYLKKADGRKAMRVVELGFGINPAHKKLMGKIVHDEKIHGSLHIAFGGLGDKRMCRVHEDIIMLKPTVYFDSRMTIKNGKIL